MRTLAVAVLKRVWEYSLSDYVWSYFAHRWVCSLWVTLRNIVPPFYDFYDEGIG